jgi:hypothetical protein
LAKVLKQNTYACTEKRATTYGKLGAELEIGEEYVHFQTLGGRTKVKLISVPLLKNNVTVEWAPIPTQDFELITETSSNTASVQSSSIASLNDQPRMEHYGSVGFREQFAAIAIFSPPVNGMEELHTLRPLVDKLPAELCSLQSIDTKV